MVACILSVSILSAYLWHRDGHADDYAMLRPAGPVEDPVHAPRKTVAGEPTADLAIPFRRCDDLNATPQIVILAHPGLATVRCRRDGPHSVLEFSRPPLQPATAPKSIHRRTIQVIKAYE